MARAVAQSRKLRLGTKLTYGFGSIAYGIKDNGFSTLLLLFYNQVIGLRADLVGLAIMVALILDAFIDPVIGHFSDHTRSRWGRRHPFMYAAALPVGVLYLLLWNPPTGSQTGTLLYLIGVAILVRTAISCYEVPSAALAPELTADYHERTSVLGWRYLFGWLGGMGMLLLTFAVILAPTPEYPVGQLNPAGYRTYAIVAASAMTFAILVSSLGTHCEIAQLPQVLATRPPLRDTFRGIVRTLRHRPFLILLAAGVFSYTAQGLNFALATYLNTYFWMLRGAVLVQYTLVIIAGVVAAFVFAQLGSKRWGKRRTAAAAFLAYPLISATPYALRLFGAFPENGSPLLMPSLSVFFLLATAASVSGTILVASMIADVVEDAQRKTAERSEGLFFAGAFFMQKCTSGVGLFLSGAILSLVGFPVGAAPDTIAPSVLSSLALAYSGSILLLMLVAALVVSRFPLGDQKEHEERLAELADHLSHAAPLPGSEPEFPPRQASSSTSQ